ncbi:hypothetical protein CRN80_12560 [Pseudomonas sp. FDAARGOS_380]|uniref:hypothetical protein n=1 Tax=Pseudomonas sp. FDAARGOS_380 TaxID=2018067 RepID=UPI000BFD4BB9|nr:hypothetical protein [Pseudomonas sp. FDAARGOS_380]ATN10432.1 hypothetical protein CRN80_12560 [Pseudomonas sp. FDAARGOS_380]
MLIDEISKGVDQDRLIVDRAFLRVSGCKNRVLLDSNSIPDACSVIEIMAGFIAGKELVLSDGMSGLTAFGRNFISGLCIDQKGLVDAFSGARLHPYISAFCTVKEIIGEGMIKSEVSGFSCGADYLIFAEALRAELDRRIGLDKLRVVARNYERNVRGNIKEYEVYVRNVFCRYPHARVMVVNINYSYSFGEGCFGVGDLAQVRKNLKSFVRNMGGSFGSSEVFGYVWKIEFGLFKRYYSKVYIFFDANYLRKLECFLEGQGKSFGSARNDPSIEFHDVVSRDDPQGRVGLVAIERQVQEEVCLIIKSDVLLRVDVDARFRSIGRSVLKG